MITCVEGFSVAVSNCDFGFAADYQFLVLAVSGSCVRYYGSFQVRRVLFAVGKLDEIIEISDNTNYWKLV